MKVHHACSSKRAYLVFVAIYLRGMLLNDSATTLILLPIAVVAKEQVDTIELIDSSLSTL